MSRARKKRVGWKKKLYEPLFEEVKLAHPNQHQRISNLKHWGGTHSHISNKYHHGGLIVQTLWRNSFINKLGGRGDISSHFVLAHI